MTGRLPLARAGADEPKRSCFAQVGIKYFSSAACSIGTVAMVGSGEEYTDALKAELKKQVRSVIGPIATPDVIHWAPGLPKTRSGKIMRRILRKISTGETDTIGDTSTLADPAVVEQLIANK